MESATVSDMSAGQDAFDQLEDRVRRLGTRLGDRARSAATQPLADGQHDTELADLLAARLSGLAEHPDLGVGEARAALAEAVAVLQHLASQARSRATVLGEITMALDFQDFSGQVVKKLLRTLGKPAL